MTSAQKHNIEWLLDTNDAESSQLIGGTSDTLKTAIPYPPEIANGYSEHVHLPDGIVVIQDRHDFIGKDRPPVIPLGVFEVSFPVPVLAVHILHHGEIEMHSHLHNQTERRQPGLDMFGRLQDYKMEQTVYTQEDIAATTLIIPDMTLLAILGAELHESLISGLGLNAFPSNNFLRIPASISLPMKDCVPEALQHSMRALYAQSKLLQYLLEINLHVSAPGRLIKTGDANSSKVEQLYHVLLSVEGETPTLTKLGQQFGMSPARLNKEFAAKYGESIYSFVANLRLSQAHEALISSDVPMKTLAHKIGYSHVNNFIIAFKNKFGVTPGSLRTKN
ncbi:DNA binding HTH domain, AraC-type [Methylophilaceae bacterium]